VAGQTNNPEKEPEFDITDEREWLSLVAALFAKQGFGPD
jgi:hypothetical protein